MYDKPFDNGTFPLGKKVTSMSDGLSYIKDATENALSNRPLTEKSQLFHTNCRSSQDQESHPDRLRHPLQNAFVFTRAGYRLYARQGLRC
jgi:hypothetical protein